MSLLNLRNEQSAGRKIIKTSYAITGIADIDILTIPKILEQVLKIHKENSDKMDSLFATVFNDEGWWSKTKAQRDDINNVVRIPNAFAISRTINGYCFGEPIKYVARVSTDYQPLVEIFSAMLDYRANHDSTIMATLTASICGLGYKLSLMTDGYVPFEINNQIIYPQNAFVVYDNTAIARKILGVYIGDYYDENNKLTDKKLYTVWTKFHQYFFIKDNNKYKAIEQPYRNATTLAYPLRAEKIPLVEVERNAFRKGDWEILQDLLALKNMLISNRADDVQQVVDYILVLMNCGFETNEEKNEILKNRLIQLTVKDPMNKPDVNILKNPLDQNGVQIFADYIDLLIQECAGIPNRQERGGGGGDTGKAVKYRNGFRDLENNAGLIIPKMDKAELEFIEICLAYCKIAGSKIKELNAYDIRNKFIRSMNDDALTASQAYINFINAGMNDQDALMFSEAVTDPSETAKNNANAREKGELFVQFTAQKNGVDSAEKQNNNGESLIK